MKTLLRLTAIATLSVTAVLAAPVITFDEGTGSNGTNQGQSVGWQFDVLVPFSVTAVGWFDEGQNGLVTSHQVGIWNPAGVLLASAVVPGGLAGTLDGQYRMVALGSALNLAVGSGYIVGGLNSSANTERLAFNVTQLVDPRIRYVDGTFSDLNGVFERPTQFTASTTGVYGPMFAIDAVPEPSSVLLVIPALAALYLRRKK